MKVTPTDSTAATEAAVASELITMHKSKPGFTVGALAVSPVITQLLGDGDPLLAYNNFKERVLAHLHAEASLPIDVALASLRLTVDRDTHLDRLVEFGEEHGYDQRQARRHSDRGVSELARLIASHWVTRASPELIVFVSRTGADTADCTIRTRRPMHIEMRSVSATFAHGPDSAVDFSLEEQPVDGGVWCVTEHRPRIALDLSVDQCSLVVVWRGELWPKFTVRWVGDFSSHAIGCETLVNTLVVSLSQL
jgi:hypothetical protein